MENSIQNIKQEVQEVLYQYQELKPIETKEDYANAGDVVKALKFKVKKLEDKRKEWTAPILASKKKIDDDFKEVTEPLLEIIGKFEKGMKVFWRAEQERMNAEQKRLENEAMEKAKKEGKSEVEVAIVNEQKSVDGNIAKTIYKEHWTYEIVDESLVPVEFKEVSDRKLKDALKNGVRKIEGLRIFDDGTIISR